MPPVKSCLFACACSGVFLAACGGGGGYGGGGGAAPKTITSPQDGAQLSAALTNIFSKVGGKPPGGKALEAKASLPVCQSGSADFTQSSSTSSSFAGNGTYTFTSCSNTAQDGTQTIENGQFVFSCTDPNQTTSNCMTDDFNSTLGQASAPLAVEFKKSPVDVLGQFFNFTVTSTDDGNSQTETLTLDGGFDVSDNTSSQCGSANFTVHTVKPLTASISSGNITAGEITLTAADNSVADVVFNSDGSETVTVNGIAQSYNAQTLQGYCGV